MVSSIWIPPKDGKGGCFGGRFSFSGEIIPVLCCGGGCVVVIYKLSGRKQPEGNPEMTNTEIIAAAKMLNGITEEAHTFAAWKARGFSVRKGEHAAFSTKIWKYKPSKKDDEDAEGHMFMKTAHFFTESQVDKIA